MYFSISSALGRPEAPKIAYETWESWLGTFFETFFLILYTAKMKKKKRARIGGCMVRFTHMLNSETQIERNF